MYGIQPLGDIVFIDEEELEGRTVKKVITYSGEVLISFTDGSYTKIVYDPGYYAGEGDVKFEEPVEYDLVQLGILDKEEYRKKQEAVMKKIDKDNKMGRKKLYESLKKEFGE